TGNLFGGDRELERANIPGQYLPTIPITQPLGMYLDVGMGDNGSRTESAAMVRVCEQRGVPVTFHDFADESHSWAAWRRNLFSSLPWVSSWFVSTAASPAPAGDKTVLAAPAAPAPTGAAAGAAPGAEAAPVDDDTEAPDALHIIPPTPNAKPTTVDRHLPAPLRAATAAARAGAAVIRHRPARAAAAVTGPATTKRRPPPAPARRGAS
ncbi:MAG TPA: hypothetical protein VK848_12200, partial [Acidimicrobiia bacterium]|nr:hypothetical protein [Acidimicrobiia bacterium]